MAFGKYAKLFTKPRKLYEKERIEEENQVIKKYGLKNKRELWKANSEIEKIRRQAKSLITADTEKQNVLIKKLQKMGFKIEKITDVLGLNKEDLVKRRIQSIVFEKKLATTPKGARQLITHKHIAIDGKIINIPSYMVNVHEEDKIQVVKIKVKKKEKKGVKQEKQTEEPAKETEKPSEESQKETDNNKPKQKQEEEK